MRGHGLLGGLIFLVAGSVALAQGYPLTPRQAEIVRAVAAVDGSLSRAQYEEFWAGFHSDAERERFRKSFRSELPAILRYQRTLWLAARESSRQRRPVITAELQKEFDQAESRPAGNRLQPAPAEMKRTARALLEAAARRGAANEEGRTFPDDARSFRIDPQVIEQVLQGLDGAIARLERLVSDSWR